MPNEFIHVQHEGFNPRVLTKKIPVLIAAVLLVFSLGIAIFFYAKYRTVRSSLNDPTVAQREQQFFANSQYGDKVIIYTNAKKAILYRPGLGKIIEVAPVNIGTQSASVQTSPSPTVVQANVILLNGTSIAGLTKKFETELLSKVPWVQIVDRVNAVKKEYTKTILVDISGTKATEANLLAQALGISVEKLPEGESASVSADFVIIVGEDKK